MGIDISALSPAAQKQVLAKLQAAQAEKAKAQEKKKHKYNAEKTTVAEIKFDSKKEARRYAELLALLKADEIRDLKLQPQFTLQESYLTATGERIRAIRYIADFSFMERRGDTWAYVVEDAKSDATRTPQYQIKKKMMAEKFGISVREV